MTRTDTSAASPDSASSEEPPSPLGLTVAKAELSLEPAQDTIFKLHQMKILLKQVINSAAGLPKTRQQRKESLPFHIYSVWIPSTQEHF